MLRLTKKTEYALLALRMLGQRDDAAAHDAPPPLVTARLVAQRYNIPEMLCAKVLQQLKRCGLLAATKGSGGGYRLARPLSEIALVTVLELFEEHITLADCHTSSGVPCPQLLHCDIKQPLAVLSAALMEPLLKMSVADLFVPASLPAPPRPSHSLRVIQG